MSQVFTYGNETAKKFGTHEISLNVSTAFGNPYFDTQITVTFTRPDGSKVTVDGFYDGGNTFKARAYCNMEGCWKWETESNHRDLEGKWGVFHVVPSCLKGKLQIHPKDPYQFAYENGDWFLHIGDTGYRYAADNEPNWKEYIDQAAAAGFTKIRVHMAQDRSEIRALYQFDRKHLNLSYWKEVDRRLTYALNHYPDVMIQLILYFEDAEEIKRYKEGEPITQLVAKHAQARFSSFANIHFCISNDLRLTGGDDYLERDGQGIVNKQDLIEGIDKAGQDMAEREPWGTLITNHQSRFSGYAYLEAPWSDIITVEDLGQVTGDLILQYRNKKKQPAVLEEDRYELWRAPKHIRYFFRRLMWASLISGGHATYGGLKTYEQYDCGLSGMYGYYDACREGKLQEGAHDYVYIHKFFKDTGLTLAGMTPVDEVVGNTPLLYKAMTSPDKRDLIVYLANPDVYEGHNPDGFRGYYSDEFAKESEETPVVEITLPKALYKSAWYNPSTGKWFNGIKASGGPCKFMAPGGGDWILLLHQQAS